MKRLLLTSFAAVTVAMTAVLAGPTTASAGGWAVTTLDPLPSIPPDATVSIGFVIRQHGVTPVDIDDVVVVVVPEQGAQQRFTARRDGPTGHYVADIRVPAGTHRWVVEQGWFGPQELGQLVVTDDATSGGGVAGQQVPPSTTGDGWGVAAGVRWALLGVTVVAAALAVTLAWPAGASRSRPAL